MKRPVIAVIILALTLILGFYSEHFVERQWTEILSNITEATEYTVHNNNTQAKKELIKAKNKLHENKIKLSITIGESEISSISNNINKAIFYLDENLKNHTLIYIEEIADEINSNISNNGF